MQQIKWDESLEQLSREKAAADATRGASLYDSGLQPLSRLCYRSQVKVQSKRREGANACAEQAYHKRCERFPSAARRSPFVSSGKPHKTLVEAPALPTDSPPVPKTEKANLEDFLDDLLG